MTAAESVVAAVTRRGAQMLALATALVEIDSPSTRPDATAQAMRRYARALEGVGFSCEPTRGRRTAGALYARPAHRHRGAPHQLVLGHLDTVWPIGTVAERPPRVEGDVLHGPGSYDMKAGLAQLVVALAALRDVGLVPSVTPVVVVNSDEEIGSPESTPLIRRLARSADRALVLEPSLGPAGLLKTARKGVGRYTLTLTGRAAHAGLDPTGGASAILELAHVIQSLFALNDPTSGVSVNVGLVDGGLRPNVIAPESRAVVDVRVPTYADAERVDAAIRAISPSTPGVIVEVSGGIGRPPMEPSPRGHALFERARALGASLGLDIDEGAAGGGSDGNTTAPLCPTLDGLGAVGGGAHALDEHVRLGTMAERSALLALLLAEPPLGRA